MHNQPIPPQFILKELLQNLIPDRSELAALPLHEHMSKTCSYSTTIRDFPGMKHAV